MYFWQNVQPHGQPREYKQMFCEMGVWAAVYCAQQDLHAPLTQSSHSSRDCGDISLEKTMHIMALFKNGNTLKQLLSH